MGKLWYLLVCVVLMNLFGCKGEEAKPPARSTAPEERQLKTIVALGDSLTAGQGVAEEQSYPAQLEKRLQADGYPYQVINAGVSGETSSGALSRLEWVLSMNPDIVILETGANDGLRGIDPQLIEDNIRKMLELLKEKNVVVVLAGMKMVRNLGPLYVARFDETYPRLADQFEPIFMPFFLKGVAMQSGLNQADAIHPNVDGYRKVVDNLYPYVLQAIARAEDRGQRTEARK